LPALHSPAFRNGCRDRLAYAGTQCPLTCRERLPIRENAQLT